MTTKGAEVPAVVQVSAAETDCRVMLMSPWSHLALGSFSREWRKIPTGQLSLPALDTSPKMEQDGPLGHPVSLLWTGDVLGG